MGLSKYARWCFRGDFNIKFNDTIKPLKSFYERRAGEGIWKSCIEKDFESWIRPKSSSLVIEDTFLIFICICLASILQCFLK